MDLELTGASELLGHSLSGTRSGVTLGGQSPASSGSCGPTSGEANAQVPVHVSSSGASGSGSLYRLPPPPEKQLPTGCVGPG